MKREIHLWRWEASTVASRARLMVVLCLLAAVPRIEAAIVLTGNVVPALPWGSSTYAYVGRTSYGGLTVDGGSALRSGYTSIGYALGATGSASPPTT